MTSQGVQEGGSAAYAALTARALGLRPCVVTACAEPPRALVKAGVAVHCVPSEATTTFSFVEGPQGRALQLRSLARPLQIDDIPAGWLRAPVVHFAPIAGEVPAEAVRLAAGRFVGLTPQGWLRRWDEAGVVRPVAWPQAKTVLGTATAAVLSLEDLDGDEALAACWAEHVPVLVLTRGAGGATVFWQGETHAVPPPQMKALDATGAGDIFAAAFFIRLLHTRDPAEAARFATTLAARSVTRCGLAAVPTPDEVATALTPLR